MCGAARCFYGKARIQPDVEPAAMQHTAVACQTATATHPVQELGTAGCALLPRHIVNSENLANKRLSSTHPPCAGTRRGATAACGPTPARSRSGPGTKLAERAALPGCAGAFQAVHDSLRSLACCQLQSSQYARSCLGSPLHPKGCRIAAALRPHLLCALGGLEGLIHLALGAGCRV